MAYGRAWLKVEVGAAGASWATATVVETDSSVAGACVRWHMHMGVADSHWCSNPDDTCLRPIGTCQMLG
jgi:hypothetical protein